MQMILAGIVSAVMVVVAPACFLNVGKEAQPILLTIDTPIERNEYGLERMVRLKVSDGQIVSLPLEEYLVGVVFAEMPASFEDEALKAQAVAARTVTMHRMEAPKHTGFDICADASCCQAWHDEEKMQEKLGTSWDTYQEKVSNAVNETDGEMLWYNGALIEALYFSCSGGMTEDAVAVWGNDVPYLQSVPSPGEEKARSYVSEKLIPTEEFRRIMEKENESVKFLSDESKWIGSVERTEGGGVAKMQIAGVWFTGTQLRKALQLNSTKFDMRISGGVVTVNVFGYGHRVGMSQYGANAMALQGCDYKEILSHYYTGAYIKKK